MSAMMLSFQAIVQPQVRYRIAEEQKEEASDDEGGQEPPGGALLHLQLRKIRNGENVERLSVKVDSEGS